MSKNNFSIWRKVLRMSNPPFNIIKFLKELSKKEIKFKDDNTNEFYEKK